MISFVGMLCVHRAMVTSAADFSDLQTKPNQTIHIYP